jgi:hypothetical protein
MLRRLVIVWGAVSNPLRAFSRVATSILKLFRK